MKYTTDKLLFYILLCFSITCSAQVQSYLTNFSSENQIKQYLATNIAKLDPVEGMYDMQRSVRTNSPFARDYDDSWIYYIVRNPISGEFTLYTGKDSDVDFGKSNNMRIEPIGETNAYRLYWRNSSNRAYLENNLRLSTKINLTQTDAKKFADNPRFAYSIVIGYDFVKTYPTTSMYANATSNSNKGTITSKWSGTGFFISKNGYIITNQHVIDGAKTIKVTSINGNHNTSYTARIEVSDKQNDLAIIKITDNFTVPTIPYSFKFSQSSVGENCWVLGYPLTQTMGEDIKLTNGIISSKSGFDGNIAQYQISAPVQPGNSGGPVFDKNGNLIGVVQAKHGAAENAGYAVKASYVRNLIDMLPNSITLTQTNMLSGKSLPQQVELASKCVVLIICE